MSDLTNPKLIYLKGFLFLIAAVASALLVWLDVPTLRNAALLGVALWCSARFYYFCFYVIEHYVDPSFKFSGLSSVALYFLSGKKQDHEKLS